jgi:hypothetical protein
MHTTRFFFTIISFYIRGWTAADAINPDFFGELTPEKSQKQHLLKGGYNEGVKLLQNNGSGAHCLEGQRI